MKKNKTLLLFIILPLILFAQTRAQNSYPTTGKALVSGLDIGADRNALSSNIGLNLGYTTLTNINITHDVWSGSHAILFNAYQALSNPSGGLNVTGNTNFSNDVGAYNGGAGSIMYFGNGGTMGFYISDASTGKDSVINWGTAEMVIKRDGKVGIGTATPSYLLDVNGTLGVSGSIGMENTNPTIKLEETGVTDQNWDIQVNNGDFQIIKVDDARSTFDEVFFISDQSQVGIGTTSPGNKLEVNGTIRSKEVIVEATNWPDYVFEEDYDLPTLSEIEAFIKANKHLPEVPSAKEMEANGISLGEMNMLLLKKIEELTLINIAQQKEIEGLKEIQINSEQGKSTELELIQELITRIEKLEGQKK